MLVIVHTSIHTREQDMACVMFSSLFTATGVSTWAGFVGEIPGLADCRSQGIHGSNEDLPPPTTLKQAEM